MSVRRILWLQAFLLMVLTLLHRFGNLDYLRVPNLLYQLITGILALYSVYLFPIIAITLLLRRKEGELTDFQITWSILAGVLLYFISLLIFLPLVQ
ncbi:hypothetical protein [uncultured Gimesia sp.]|uniref:hypothetical protein n=1 Tax=uncultured Gimesia sp. TaxID=1678688 RepID=UPI00262EABFB|nr:hypothetical protein [uncultured Gimesia sp.]